MSSLRPPEAGYSCLLHERLAAEVRAGLRDIRCTQGWLAEHLDLSEKHVSQVLTGRATGALEVWDAMLRAVQRTLPPLSRSSEESS